MDRVTLVSAVGLAYVATSVVGTALSRRHGLVAEWGGKRRGTDAPRDALIWPGTGLAAPLAGLVPQAAISLALPRLRREAQETALLTMARMGVGEIIGAVGEPPVWNALRGRYGALAAATAAAQVALPVAQIVLSLRAARQR